MKEESESENVQTRNLVTEIVGTIVSMLLGAFVALLIGGNGFGFVSFILLCSFMGWVVWVRRRRSFLLTIGICGLLLVLWWPIGLIIRDMDPGR